MLSREDMHPYQNKAEKFLREREGAALWMDMGLGKTVSTLTAADVVLTLGTVDAFLLFAPIRVITTVWRQEALKWEHTRHLRFSLVHGNERQRYDALRRKADIYLVNYENMVWLFRAMRIMPDFPKNRWGAIFDESSLLKSSKTKRFRSLRHRLDLFALRWELTGTPAPNSYLDVFSQILVLDKGQRFGTVFQTFKEHYFQKNEYNKYKQVIRNGATRRIERAISPLVLRLDARDYLRMPKTIYNEIPVALPPAVQSTYDHLEAKFFAELDEVEVQVFNAAALTAKLWQFANGAVYVGEPPARSWHPVHDTKLQALGDIIEEASGQPVLVAYWFKSDLERLKAAYAKELKTGRAAVLSEAKCVEDVVNKWNRREYDILFIHPASGGHGLNLQQGGHILVFFSLLWSLEMHDQLVARLARQGQLRPVIVHYLIAVGTVDEALMDALQTKARSQRRLLDALNKYRISKEHLS